MEQNRDSTSCGNYQGRSLVECDLKMLSGVRCESNGFESTEQVMETEKLLKQKELEVEIWEEKYNKIKEEYAALMEKLTNENQKSFEVSPTHFFMFFPLTLHWQISFELIDLFIGEIVELGDECLSKVAIHHNRW